MTNNDQNSTNPPYRNTGAMDTNIKPLRALVDWVSATFFDVQNWQKLTEIIGLNPDDFEVQNKGYKGYLNTAKYKDITIAFGQNEHASNMGIHLDMSGQACRQYEQIFATNNNVWSDLFLIFICYDHNITRLDIAIDDFKGYFTIDQVYNCAKKGQMTAKRVKKARSYEEFFIEDGKTDSRTFYVGKTDWVIRFYDKLIERKNKGYNFKDDLNFWQRYEVQLRGKVATSAVKVLAYEAYELGEFVKGFMADKIDFKIKNKNDSNKSRWRSKRWWRKFLKDVDKIPLTQVAPDPTIPKMHSWLDKQVNASFMTYLEAFDHHPIVYEFFKVRGMDKIDKQKQSIIDDFNKNPTLKDRMLADMAHYIKNKKDNQLG